MIHRYPIRSSPISQWVPSIIFNGIQDWFCLRLLKSWEVQSTVSRRGLTISYRLTWNSDRRGSALCWEKQCSTESISGKVWNQELELNSRCKYFQFFSDLINNSANRTHEDSENLKDPNMPKPKNKKNPYIYFCLERKQSEEKYRGKSLRELVELCNAEWTQMSK